jgi:iron complex outermembrane receptor protein
MIGKKALLRATVSASLLAVAMAVVPTPATAQPVAYQLRDMSLSRALREFGRVSGQQIIFAEALVRGRRAPALVGVFAPEEALGRLLAGSGLQADRTPSGAYMIVRATPAPGEDPAGSAPAESESAEQIVVTGTRIRGASPAAPVTQITRADIEQSGQSQIGEILRNVPQNFSGGANRGSLASPVVAPNNFSDATLVNLRGAGADATLVLVNGNRIAIDAIWGGADVGAIPLSAIERVDIVTDGASALYGGRTRWPESSTSFFAPISRAQRSARDWGALPRAAGSSRSITGWSATPGAKETSSRASNI